jgi:cell division protease FtsH
MFPGIGASRIRDLIDQGKKNAPCIVFIDDIDAVGRRRIACPDPLKFEQELTLSQLLSELDGFESNDGVIIMAATDRPDLLDEALLRPGRFEVTIEVSYPTPIHFESMLRISTRAVPLDSDVNLAAIAAHLQTRLPNALGNVVATVVNNAAIQASKAGAKKVGNSFFLEAIEYEAERNMVLDRERES